MSDCSTHIHLSDEAATTTLGAALADALRDHDGQVASAGFVLGLSGDLGAGKTSLVRSLLRRLGVTGPVKSPTFALLEPYVLSSLNFYHFDFYRFSKADEFVSAGFRELFAPGNVCAIEWPERAGDRLPTPDLVLTFKVMETGREVSAAAHSELGLACWRQAMEAMTSSRTAPAAD